MTNLRRSSCGGLAAYYSRRHRTLEARHWDRCSIHTKATLGLSHSPDALYVGLDVVHNVLGPCAWAEYFSYTGLF